MAYEENLQKITAKVNSDLSAAQFHFVVMGADGYLDLSGDGGVAIGVLQDDPNGSSNATVGCVATNGVTKVEAGEAITAGDAIASNSAGEAVTATTGDIVLGYAMEDASGDGSYFPMLLAVAAEPLA